MTNLSNLSNLSRPLPLFHPKTSFKQKRNFFNFSDIMSSKKSYTGNKIVGYTQKQLFDVVSNVDDYYNFIPFCINSEVLKTQYVDQRTKILTAALGVQFIGYSETYVSEVTCKRPSYVQAVASADSLFNHLTTLWQFIPDQKLPPTHCHLDFYIEFEFSSPLYAQVSNMFTEQINEIMVTAFEKRCEEIYGPPAHDPQIVDDN
ncbi:10918_t:CDS:2 [Diversispora eburnea]|uniref:10918_t:CDS:1 n=1 Tax=Diversispora eburnea TaxID=1213867 RepID=A0A9N8UXQ1_9GLOM|nr:10918_t:CDS:2 [Diversispora eburnea]